MSLIAVIDIGKTNAKLALVDGETLTEIAVVTQPNTVLPGPPHPHFDLERHWQFFLHHLAAFHREHGVSAISVTTHGASGVLLDAAGNLATPMLDYEHTGPDQTAKAYNALRPDFAETGSARLAGGLNLGAQLHWLLQNDPGLAARTAHVVTYPGYWGFRLTGELASDVTSLGCHTDLWNPWGGQFSALPDRLGLADRIAPARRPAEILGTIRPAVTAATGLPSATRVTTGIHDSNASLLTYVLGRKPPFAVVSTGTWVVSMAMGGRKVVLNPTRDVLVNVNALGQAVPSARFMGGREYEILRAGSNAQPTEADRAAVLNSGAMILPAVEPGSGPFAGQEMRWTAIPATDGQRMAALSFYLAMMTQTCLDLIGADGLAIIEGPFASNPDYLAMLAALRDGGVETATSATGTSIGAALLCLNTAAGPVTQRVMRSGNADAMRAYCDVWRSRIPGRCEP